MLFAKQRLLENDDNNVKHKHNNILLSIQLEADVSNKEREFLNKPFHCFHSKTETVL